jgi:hypothetical protein
LTEHPSWLGFPTVSWLEDFTVYYFQPPVVEAA